MGAQHTGQPACGHIALQVSPPVEGDLPEPRSISSKLAESEKVTYQAMLQTVPLGNEQLLEH